LFGLSGLSSLFRSLNQTNQTNQTDQMNQIPATRREMFDCKTWHSFFGKSQEGDARRLYVETADDTQRDAHASDALADGTASAHLRVKTVADPEL
jgi:hypothetical protein